MPNHHARTWHLRARGLAALGTCAALALGTVAATGGAARTDSQRVAAVVSAAKQQVGDAYQWGGNGPDAWDCSGFTSYLWRQVGGVSTIPRVSRDQQRWAVPIPREQLLTGDLVFFGSPVSHVGLYVGSGRIVDASSSRKGVLERALWTSGVVRYGRVPRSGMPPVKPWAAPSTAPNPAPTKAAPTKAAPTKAAPTKAAPTKAAPTKAPAPKAAPAKAAPRPAPASTAPRPVGSGPLLGLPSKQRVASSPVMLGAAANAKRVAGSAAWTDLQLVRAAWSHAGGGTLPADRARLVALSRRVPLSDARVGDVVVYGAPAQHLGIYLGGGYMVDASKVLRKVVVRRVFTSETVRLVRLPVVARTARS